ncbi:uncharacterized protein [Ambystoma mexicanum]|uniref:uncharacterized protein n=1 Tax=Ambystoma mexicanum TaxID=8296 RepID=UPI0037E8E45B
MPANPEPTVLCLAHLQTIKDYLMQDDLRPVWVMPAVQWDMLQDLLDILQEDLDRPGEGRRPLVAAALGPRTPDPGIRGPGDLKVGHSRPDADAHRRSPRASPHLPPPSTCEAARAQAASPHCNTPRASPHLGPPSTCEAVRAQAASPHCSTPRASPHLGPPSTCDAARAQAASPQCSTPRASPRPATPRASPRPSSGHVDPHPGTRYAGTHPGRPEASPRLRGPPVPSTGAQDSALDDLLTIIEREMPSPVGGNSERPPTPLPAAPAMLDSEHPPFGPYRGTFQKPFPFNSSGEPVHRPPGQALKRAMPPQQPLDWTPSQLPSWLQENRPKESKEQSGWTTVEARGTMPPNGPYQQSVVRGNPRGHWNHRPYLVCKPTPQYLLHRSQSSGIGTAGQGTDKLLVHRSYPATYPMGQNLT